MLCQFLVYSKVIHIYTYIYFLVLFGILFGIIYYLFIIYLFIIFIIYVFIVYLYIYFWVLFGILFGIIYYLLLLFAIIIILFGIILHHGLLPDIEYSSLCYKIYPTVYFFYIQKCVSANPKLPIYPFPIQLYIYYLHLCTFFLFCCG